MTTQAKVESLIKQTQRYEFEDGLRDWQLALMLLTMGVMCWFVIDLPNVWGTALVRVTESIGKWTGWSFPVIFVLVMVVPTLAALLVMRVVRRRWLWRSSGQVRPKRTVVPARTQIESLALILAALGGAYTLKLGGRADDVFIVRTLMVACGWSMGYTMWALGRQIDLPRYRTVGIVGSLLTAPLLLLPITLGQTCLGMGLLWAAVLAVSGYRPLREKARQAALADEALPRDEDEDADHG